ncbi:MAG: hypothetical protein EZS28_040316, partial [Streblomastix strix]
RPAIIHGRICSRSSLIELKLGLVVQNDHFGQNRGGLISNYREKVKVLENSHRIVVMGKGGG